MIYTDQLSIALFNSYYHYGNQFVKALQANPHCFLQTIEKRHNLRYWHWQQILRKIPPEKLNGRMIYNTAMIFHRQKLKLDTMLRHYARQWYKRTILPRKKVGQIVARKDGKEDRIYNVHYDEKRHPFWTSAFSGLFGGGKDDDGRLIMAVDDIGTSQEAIGAYCDHVRDPGSKVVESVFYEAAIHGRGSQILDHMVIIGRLWDNPKFADTADSMLSDYIDDTLYRKDINKDERLSLFVKKDILKARAVWEGIFNTGEKRLALAVQLMPSKRFGAFRRCETVDQLVDYLDMLRRTRR
jgi:hypothetical protein